MSPMVSPGLQTVPNFQSILTLRTVCHVLSQPLSHTDTQMLHVCAVQDLVTA